jgi:hypothetical protein
MKALLAWQELKQAEVKPHHTPGFTLLQGSVGTDLRSEYSFFLFTSMQMHSVLNNSDAGLSNVRRQQVKQRLAKIESQLYSLNLQKKALLMDSTSSPQVCHRPVPSEVEG